MATVELASPSPSRMSITPRRTRSNPSQLPEPHNGELQEEEEEVGRLEEEVAQMEQRIANFKETCQARALALQERALDKYLGSLVLDNHVGKTGSAENQGLQTAPQADLDDNVTTEMSRSLFERRTVARAQMAQIVDRTTELSQILHIQLLGTPVIDSPLLGRQG